MRHLRAILKNMKNIHQQNLILSSEIGQICIRNKLTISTAESCTGGLLSSYITDISGSAKYFMMGLVVYNNIFKQKLLNVKDETIIFYGAVSEPVAKEMAENLKKITNTDITISITGIAGPTGGTKEKPVGTVFICIFYKDKLYSFREHFMGQRLEIKEQICLFVFNQLKLLL